MSFCSASSCCVSSVSSYCPCRTKRRCRVGPRLNALSLARGPLGAAPSQFQSHSANADAGDCSAFEHVRRGIVTMLAIAPAGSAVPSKRRIWMCGWAGEEAIKQISSCGSLDRNTCTCLRLFQLLNRHCWSMAVWPWQADRSIPLRLESLW